MSNQNTETGRSLFKAVEEPGLAGIIAAYHPDITIREVESLPYGRAERNTCHVKWSAQRLP